MVFKYILPFFLILTNLVEAQDLHPLEPVTKHYEKLQAISAKPNKNRSNLDKITFPLTGRTSGRQYIGIEPSYLTQANVDFLKQSVQFPANSSDQTRAELDYLLTLEKKRTKAQEDRVLKIARIGYWPPLDKNSDTYGHNVEHLFWEYEQVVGTEYNLESYPATLKILAGVTRDMRIIEFTVKYHLLRARPYHLETKLDAMANISSPSFASGHTLWAYIQAFTWSELLPEKRKAFLDIAYEVGESREIMGIHYPSDEEAARVLAHKMLVLMLDNSGFVQDLNQAKQEWK